MTTKIRPASLQDVVAIMEIENSTNQVPWTKNQFISSMEVGHYSMVLQQYQKVIGFAIYAPIIPESHLLNIAINPAYQGQGLGEKLLEKIIFQNKTPSTYSQLIFTYFKLIFSCSKVFLVL